MSLERRIFYIDGFNLYFGLKERGWRRYYWLDIERLCSRLIRPNQQLVKVHYFTARLTGPDQSKRLRQKTYLEALETLPRVEIHYGHYLAHDYTCRKCGLVTTRYDEKKSDVNLALKLLTDGLDNLYDTAVIVSGDSDLGPGIEAVKKYAPNKKVALLFPPNRSSAFLKGVCDVFLGTLNEGIIKKSQFSEVALSKTGYPLQRPSKWK